MDYIFTVYIVKNTTFRIRPPSLVMYDVTGLIKLYIKSVIVMIMHYLDVLTPVIWVIPNSEFCRSFI